MSVYMLWPHTKNTNKYVFAESMSSTMLYLYPLFILFMHCMFAWVYLCYGHIQKNKYICICNIHVVSMSSFFKIIHIPVSISCHIRIPYLYSCFIVMYYKSHFYPPSFPLSNPLFQSRGTQDRRLWNMPNFPPPTTCRVVEHKKKRLWNIAISRGKTWSTRVVMDTDSTQWILKRVIILVWHCHLLYDPPYSMTALSYG